MTLLRGMADFSCSREGSAKRRPDTKKTHVRKQATIIVYCSPGGTATRIGTIIHINKIQSHAQTGRGKRSRVGGCRLCEIFLIARQEEVNHPDDTAVVARISP